MKFSQNEQTGPNQCLAPVVYVLKNPPNFDVVTLKLLSHFCNFAFRSSVWISFGIYIRNDLKCKLCWGLLSSDAKFLLKIYSHPRALQISTNLIRIMNGNLRRMHLLTFFCLLYIFSEKGWMLLKQLKVWLQNAIMPDWIFLWCQAISTKYIVIKCKNRHYCVRSLYELVRSKWIFLLR